MTKPFALITIGLGLPLIAAIVWIAKNADDLFSWSPKNWEHEDRNDTDRSRSF